MKHIFLIHSQITYAVSRGVIEKENITLDDVVLIGDRGFSIKSEYRFFPINFPNKYFLLRKNIILGYYYLGKIDNFIKKITENDSFVIYCPHTYLNIIKILLTNKFCRGHYLIEEGLSSYYEFKCQKILQPPIILNNKQKALSRFIYQNRWTDAAMFRDDHMGTFAIHPAAFPGFKNKSIVKPKFDKSYDITKLNLFEDKLIVVVFDSLVENSIIDIKSCLLSLEIIASDILQRFPGIGTVYYKLHPYQLVCDRYYPKMIDELSTGLGKNINLTLLSNEFSIEGQSTLVKTIAYSIVSSVSVYVNWFGGIAYSAAKSIPSSEIKFRDHFNNLPVIFNETIIFI